MSGQRQVISQYPVSAAVACEFKERLIKELKTSMVAWGAAHNHLSHAWAVGSERDGLQQTLDGALAVRERARAEYRKHREEHGC
jgi:hypothetical protein